MASKVEKLKECVSALKLFVRTQVAVSDLLEDHNTTIYSALETSKKNEAQIRNLMDRLTKLEMIVGGKANV